MRQTPDNARLTLIWHEHLVEGQVYDLDQLCDVAARVQPGRFGDMSRHQLGTRIAEQTDIGEDKVSQYSFQFRKLERDRRLYLGLPLDDIERQVALLALTRQERDAFHGRLTGHKSRVRKALRGKDGVNVARKLRAQKGRCGICGSHIYPGHAANAELDHILALGNGGPDTLENTRAVHGRCNAVLADTEDEARARRILKVWGWPVDADAAEVATAKAKSVC